MLDTKTAFTTIHDKAFAIMPNLGSLQYPKENLLREDSFSRSHLVNILSEFAQRDGDERDRGAPIIGLDGAWGSGKTWIAVKTLQVLRESGFVTVNTSAWRYRTASSLAIELMRAISRAVYRDLTKEMNCAKKVGLWLKLSLRHRNPSQAFRDIAGQLASAAASAETGFPLNLRRLFSEPSLKSKIRRVNKLLKIEHVRLAIVVDDLDRAFPDEAISCLSFLRDLVDIGARIVICCFDRTVIEKRLGDLRDERFIEKILPMVIPVEKPELAARFIFLRREIDSFLLQVARLPEESKMWPFWMEAVRQVAEVCETPRELIRVGARFATHFLAVRGDHNVYRPHLLLISAIHEISPRLWFYLRDNQGFFDSIFTETDVSKLSNEIPNTILQTLKPCDLRPNEEKLAAVLLTPCMKTFVTMMNVGSAGSSSPIWDKSCQAYYFQFRDHISIVPRDQFAALLDEPSVATKGGVEILRKTFRAWFDKGQGFSLLNLLEHHMSSRGPEIATNALIAMLIELNADICKRSYDDAISSHLLLSATRSLLNLVDVLNWKTIWTQVLPKLDHPDACLILSTIIGDRLEAGRQDPAFEFHTDTMRSLIELAIIRMKELLLTSFFDQLPEADERQLGTWCRAIDNDFGVQLLERLPVGVEADSLAQRILNALSNYKNFGEPPNVKPWQSQHAPRLEALGVKWKGTTFGAMAEGLVRQLSKSN